MTKRDLSFRQMVGKRLVDDEGGAVLVLVTLLMVVLFGFAALTVDLGAAWAERRQDQSAADAAAMAAAIEYVRGAPTDDDIIAIVKDFVEQNIGYPADGAGWATCPAPTEGFIALSGTNCVSLKQTATLANDVLVKVRVPTQEVATTFGRLLGFESISVSAEAIARIEANPGVFGAMPYAIPSGLSPGSEYCLGSPPQGLSRDVCNGGEKGQFGTIDSPEFKAEQDPWGTTGNCDDTGDRNARTQLNTALGIDHFLRIANEDELAINGPDVCTSAEAAIIPYALVGNSGGILSTQGFIGDGPYGSLSLPGRLRQQTLAQRDMEFAEQGPKSTSTIGVDNVGLWAYLDNVGLPLSDECSSSKFTGAGPSLTEALALCLKDGTVKFTADLLTSPRFGLAPVISPSSIAALSPATNQAVNIADFAPVYIQSTWFNCENRDCKVKWEDATGAVNDNFDPGEGPDDALGCQLDDEGACSNSEKTRMDGLSVFLLTGEDWMPESFENAFGDPGGFNVYLFR